MTIQQFAKSRNLSVAKVRELSNNLLGKMPSRLTTDEVIILDNALAKTAKALMAANNEDVGELSPEVAEVVEAIDAQTTYQTTKIIGEDVLKKNVLLYLSYLKTHLLEHKLQVEKLSFQIEQSYYSELAHFQRNLYEDGKARIRKNTNAALKLFSSENLTEEINNTENEELKPLMADALEFLNNVGL